MTKTIFNTILSSRFIVIETRHFIYQLYFMFVVYSSFSVKKKPFHHHVQFFESLYP